MLGYELIVANIENAFAAHIHCGAKGVNGPVGVTLFVGAPGGGRVDGILAQGTVGDFPGGEIRGSGRTERVPLVSA